jgi:hypothetical protein
MLEGENKLLVGQNRELGGSCGGWIGKMVRCKEGRGRGGGEGSDGTGTVRCD